MAKFTKADSYVGKHLTLYVGGGDRTIQDGEELEGEFWRKFVGMGYLKEVKAEPAKAAAPPAKKPAEKPKVREATAPDPLTAARMVESGEADKVTVVPDEVASVPEPPPEPPKDDGGISKSPAGKMAEAAKGATGTSTKKRGSRRKKR